MEGENREGGERAGRGRGGGSGKERIGRGKKRIGRG